MEQKHTVLMLCFPASGHFNPFVCYGSELAKNKNLRIIMYSIKQNKEIIERANIEFRQADIEIPFFPVDKLRNDVPIGLLMGYFMDVSIKLLPELIRCVEDDKVDLVVYDKMTVFAKWLLKYLRAKHQSGKLKRPPPRALTITPSLAFEKEIYPNCFEEKIFGKPKLGLVSIFKLLIFFRRYVAFCFRNGFPVDNPFRLIFEEQEPLCMVCVFPEFQPRSYLFPKSIKFVGDCASEEVRAAKNLEEPLKSFLAPFPEINPLPLVDLKVDESLINRNLKLIYVSLGTVVNTDVNPFLQLIEGIKAINKSLAPDTQYKFLMSVGDISYKVLQTKINSKELEIPGNLLIMAKVPQLDVLKRASLYITHSGQGSTNEAIRYGVPMVCIPVFGDQPLVAYRVADELGLGLQLKFDDLNPEAIKNAALKVIQDKSFLERILLFSQISRKYNGAKEASRITIEYLEEAPKSKSD